MDVGDLLLAVVAVSFGAIGLLGLGWLLEGSLRHQVRTWIRQLRGDEADRNRDRTRNH